VKNKRIHIALMFSIIIGLLAIGAIAAKVLGETPEAALGRKVASGVNENDVVVKINDSSVSLGVLSSTAYLLQEQEGISSQEAYQKALNLITQNTLFRQEAKKRGVVVSEEEIKVKAKELIEQAKKDKRVEDYLAPQAKSKGLSIDSPEFEKELEPLMKASLEDKKLNDQLLEQSGQDLQKFYSLKAEAIKDLLLKASITLNTSVLPAEVQNIHVPSLEEMPYIKTPLQDLNGGI
jgi:hypothetical protein